MIDVNAMSALKMLFIFESAKLRTVQGAGSHLKYPQTVQLLLKLFMSSKHRSEDMYGQLKKECIYLLNQYFLGHGSLEDVSVTCNLSKDSRTFIRLARGKHLTVAINHRKRGGKIIFTMMATVPLKQCSS